MDTFLDKLFTQASFDPEFVLIDEIDGANSQPLRVPDETASKDSLLNWVNHIKALQRPNWIGLPNNADKVLIAERGKAKTNFSYDAYV